MALGGRPMRLNRYPLSGVKRTLIRGAKADIGSSLNEPYLNRYDALADPRGPQ